MINTTYIHLKFIIKILCLMGVCLLIGCSKSNNLKEEVDHLVGRTISVPLPTDAKCKYKIVYYVDSIGCIPCKIKPNKWMAFKDKTKTVNYEIIFITHPNAYHNLLKLIKAKDLSFVRVVLDKNNTWFKQLNITYDLLLNTFLLDSTNKVVLVGSPFYNEKMEQIYISTISK